MKSFTFSPILAIAVCALLSLTTTRTTTFAFVTPTTQQQRSSSLTYPRHPFVALSAAGNKGKGFGAAPEEPKRKAAAAVEQRDSSTDTQAAPSQAAFTPAPKTTELNAGQKALEDMRRVQAEKRDDELRKVRELVQTDAQIQQAPAVIPEKVAQRMGKRMLPFVGIPLLGGMGAFVTFWYLATYKNVEYEPVMVAGSTIAILVFSLMGITYSVMSASWDPEREGDLVGGEEFSRNLGSIKDGFGRSRENALLRDKMAGLTGEELDKAIKELDRREAAENKRMQSLSNKLKDELE